MSYAAFARCLKPLNLSNNLILSKRNSWGYDDGGGCGSGGMWKYVML